MLQFNGLAGLPSYLQRSCYIPKHLGKHSSKPTKLKMQSFLRLNLFVYSRHKVHSMNTHTAERRLMKTDNTERSTRHWSRRNHRVADTFCNCIN